MFCRGRILGAMLIVASVFVSVPSHAPLAQAAPSGSVGAGPGGIVPMIAAGGEHTCVLLPTGTVECWGWNNFGQLGNVATSGNANAYPTPTAVELSPGTWATAIAGGNFHTCALLSNGTIECWGRNDRGQLGNAANNGIANGTPNPTPAPVMLTGGATATGIAAGHSHTCALLSNGTVECWGNNFSGQLGNNVNNGNDLANPTPAAVTLTGGAVATSVTAAGEHTCALLSNGTIECWGDNRHGELGNTVNNGVGLANPTPAAVTLTGGAVATSVTAAGDHTCALLSNGTIECWGVNRYGQLGNNINNGNEVANPTPAAVALTGGAAATAVIAGGAHTCALLSAGTIECWGYNRDGQLADSTNTGTLNANPTPVAVTLIGGGAIAVGAGQSHTCALSPRGTIECWGKNFHGQLGTSSNNGRSTANPAPAVVPLSGAVNSPTAISAGDSHTCALLANGTIECWGLNFHGQLGSSTNSGDVSPNPVPASVALSGGAAAAGVASGGRHTCALLSNGTIECWGDNLYGQLGSSSNSGGYAPNPVPASVALSGGAAATAVASGGRHTCALLSNGTVECWGHNSYGQLGNSTNNASDVANAVPQAVALTGGATATAITAGESHTCALLSNGVIECWGFNRFGQLGHAANNGDDIANPVPLPVVLSGGGTAAAVVAGDYHTCARLSNGSVECWGSNVAGQLGITANTTANPTPASVTFAGPAGAAAVAAGQVHTCVLLSDGAVECWGYNFSGQLGNTTNIGTSDANAVPVKVTFTAGALAVAITTGRSHTCALLSNGTVECWGYNFSGQLGDTVNSGASIANPSPSGVGAPSVAVTAGASSSTAVMFTVSFGSAVTGFDDAATDVQLSGTTGGTLIAEITSLTSSTYTVAVTGMAGPGDVTLAIPASAATGATYLQPNVAAPVAATVSFVTVSDPPTGVTATAGDGTASVSWTAPTNTGGAPITSYQVEQSVDGGGTWTFSASADGTSAGIVDLANDKAVSFRVSTVNAIGIGIASVVSQPVTPTMPPVLSVAVGAGQVDPIAASPVVFDVTFDQSVTGFDSSDVTIGGTAGATTGAVTGAGPYMVRVSGMTGAGTVSVSVRAGAAVNANDQTNAASSTVSVNVVVAADAPTGVMAVGGDAFASLSWTTPADSGGSPITGYLVEQSIDGGSTWTIAVADTGSTSTTAQINSLTNGMPVVFRVSAINATGASTPSPASSVVTPTAPVAPPAPVTPGAVSSLDPERFVDSRATGETLDAGFQRAGEREAGSEYRVQIAGRGMVPAGAKAVVANITAIRPNDVGFVTAHPCLDPRPLASSLNYSSGVSLGNEVIVPLTSSGELCLYTSSATHLAVDVVGYVDAASPTMPTTPARFLDTRLTGETFDKTAQGDGRVEVGGQLTLPVAGRGEIPSDAAAVIVNVTAIGAAGTGFATAHPCLDPRPNAASLNYVAGVNRGNELIVQLDATGSLCLFSSAAVHLTADIVGYLPAGTNQTSIAPARFIDSRSSGVTVDGTHQASGKLAAGSELRVKIAGRGDVPDNVTAVGLNVTAIQPELSGFITIHPCQTARPNTASLNYTPAVNGGNDVIARVDKSGDICVYTSAATHIAIDITNHATLT